MKNRLYFVPAAIIVATLLLVGTFCDLSVAKALFHIDNGFSHFMAAFAVVPIGIALGFILGTLFRMVVKKQYKKKWQNVVLVIISFVGLIAGTYFCGDHFTSYHAYNLPTWLNVMFGSIFVVPGYILGYFFYDEMNKKNLIKTYLLIVVTVLFLIATIEVFKILFPRLRYTSIVALGDDSLFRPWYLTDFSLDKEWAMSHSLVNPEEIKSFPSGHSNLGLSIAFVMMFIPKFFNELKGKEVHFFYIGFIFFLLVAFSRILIGAHYLSDTMFAGTLALFVYFISNEIYLRKII